MIKQIYELALQAYGSENTSSLSLYEKLYHNHPENFIVEHNNGEVLGYIIVCYLNEYNFAKSISQGFTENQIDFTSQKEKTSNIYFFSIVVSEQGSLLTSLKLIKRFQSYLKDNHIKQVSALIYSKEGLRLAKILKMKEVHAGIFCLKIT